MGQRRYQMSGDRHPYIAPSYFDVVPGSPLRLKATWYPGAAGAPGSFWSSSSSLVHHHYLHWLSQFTIFEAIEWIFWDPHMIEFNMCFVWISPGKSFCYCDQRYQIPRWTTGPLVFLVAGETSVKIDLTGGYFRMKMGWLNLTSSNRLGTNPIKNWVPLQGMRCATGLWNPTHVP